VKSNFVEPWLRFGKLEQARFALTLHKVWRVKRKRVLRCGFCTQTSADQRRLHCCITCSSLTNLHFSLKNSLLPFVLTTV